MTTIHKLQYTSTNNFGASKNVKTKNIFIQGDFSIRNYDERKKNQKDYLPDNYIKIIGSDNNLTIEEGHKTAKKTSNIADFSEKKAKALEYIANLDGNSTLSKDDITLLSGQEAFVKKDLNLTDLAKDINAGVLTLKWGEKDILRIDFRQKNENTKSIEKEGNLKTADRKSDKNINKKNTNSYDLVKINKNTQQYLDALAIKESSGDHFVQNSSGYTGKYQMGEAAMVALGIYKETKNVNYYNNDWSGIFKKNKFGITSLWDYRTSPEKQDQLIVAYKKIEWGYIKHFKLDEYVGKTINGIKITKSGMLAGTHLVGIGGLKVFLESNGTKIPKDGNNTPITEYLSKFANYDVSQLTTA